MAVVNFFFFFFFLGGGGGGGGGGGWSSCLGATAAEAEDRLSIRLQSAHAVLRQLVAEQSRFMSACSNANGQREPAAKGALDPANPLHRALLRLETCTRGGG